MSMHKQYSYISYVLFQGEKREERIQNTCFARAVELWESAPNTITKVEVYPSAVYLEYFGAVNNVWMHAISIMDVWIVLLNTLFGKKLYSRHKQVLIYEVPEGTTLIEFKFHLFLLRAMFNTPSLSFIKKLPPTADPQVIWTRICFFLCLESIVGDKHWSGLHDEVHCLYRQYHLSTELPTISFQKLLADFKKFPDSALTSVLYREGTGKNTYTFFQEPNPVFLQPSEFSLAGNIELFVLPEIEKFRAFLEEAQAVRT
jgi:hypothetical protein